MQTGFFENSVSVSKLRNVIDSIGERVDAIIESNEKDFMVAYKNHMMKFVMINFNLCNVLDTKKKPSDWSLF